MPQTRRSEILQQRSMSCDQCGASFKRREHLARHVQRHSGSRPFQCTLCTKAFSRRDTLKRHAITHKNDDGNVSVGLDLLRRSSSIDGSTLLSGNDTQISEDISAIAAAEPDVIMTSTANPIDTTETWTADGHQNIPELGDMAMDYGGDMWNFPWALHDRTRQSSPLWWILEDSPLRNEIQPVTGSDSLQTSVIQQEAPTANQQTTHNQGHNERSLPVSIPTTPRLLSTEDRNITLMESFGHLGHVFSQQSKDIAGRLEKASLSSLLLDDQTFQSFLELYFEYFDYQFSFIHPSMLDNKSSSCLLLAMAAIGAQYSTISDAAEWASTLRKLLREVIKSSLPNRSPDSNLVLAHSALLLGVCMLFAGDQESHISWQQDRHILFSLFRMMATREIRSKDVVSPSNMTWHQWLVSESQKRLLNCIYRLHCLEYILLDQHPEFDLSHLNLEFELDDVAWGCRTEQAWIDQTNSQSPQASMSASASVLDRGRDSPWTSAHVLQSISIYVEERILLSHLQTSSLTKGLSLCTTEPRQFQSDSISEQLQYKLMIPTVTAHVDQKFEYYQSTALQITHGETTKDALPFFLNLLRLIPLRTIYRFSGWQATDSQVETARSCLDSWIKNNQSSSRLALWYAVQIFAILRLKTHFACYDGLHLLTAGLYIWAYDLYTPEHSFSSLPVLRLDRVLDKRDISDWIEGGAQKQVHITGIGPLAGSESAHLALNGLRSVLSSRIGWSKLCHRLARNVTLLLEGHRPGMEA